LGGVKTPFNLNYEDDIYKDATLVFYMENKHAVLQVILGKRRKRITIDFK